jgi:hypothetical protein
VRPPSADRRAPLEVVHEPRSTRGATVEQ